MEPLSDFFLFRVRIFLESWYFLEFWFVWTIDPRLLVLTFFIFLSLEELDELLDNTCPVTIQQATSSFRLNNAFLRHVSRKVLHGLIIKTAHLTRQNNNGRVPNAAFVKLFRVTVWKVAKYDQKTATAKIVTFFEKSDFLGGHYFGSGLYLKLN